MRLICPSCAAAHSAEAWANDAIARQCLAIVAELPAPVSRRSLAYLALFRPASGRGLQWGKALRLLSELRGLVIDAYVQWDGKVARPNSATAWGDAMEQVISHPPKRLPLKSHGYLHAIAYDLANDADRAVEVRKNKAERHGHLIGDGNKMAEPEQPQWQPGPDDFRKIRDVIREVGKKI
jgi:hypothetical protein